jgi:Ca-activated chloride channel family protein
MSHPWFANPEAFWLLALVPLLGVLALYARRRRRKALAHLGSSFALKPLMPPRGKVHLLRGLCLVLGLVFLVGGIAGPQWGLDWSQGTKPGRDLVVVLDLSRSMLAEQPSRQERAKKALLDLSYTVQKRGGHRLALVVFAAKAKVVCPLTHDYEHFRYILKKQDAADLPLDLRAGTRGATSGTRIGEGIRLALEAHDPRFKGFQDILLISDGDDPAGDGEWGMGAAEARQHKVPVHTVGVGNPDTPSSIPIPGGVLRHEGEVVQTRLQEQPLEEIARRTGGVYIPARTEHLPLGKLFRDYIDARPLREDTDDVLAVYQQQYSLFFASALGFLTLSTLIGLRRVRPVKARSLPAAARPPESLVRRVTREIRAETVSPQAGEKVA